MVKPNTEKVSKIANTLIMKNSGFMPEQKFDASIKKITEGFEEKVIDMGLPIFNVNRELLLDNPSKEYFEGVAIKKWQYTYDIPYRTEKGKEGHMGCFINITYQHTGAHENPSYVPSELWGTASCGSDTDTVKILEKQKRIMGMDIVEKNGKWIEIYH